METHRTFGDVSAKDLLLLSQLRRNAREKLTTMSRRTQIPVSTIHEKIKGFNARFVKKHTVLLDFPKLGYQCRAKVLVNAPKEHKLALKEHLEKHANVNSAYKINNGYTYMLDVIFPNLDQLDGFLDELEAEFDVKDTQTYYIIDELKREGFLTDMMRHECQEQKSETQSPITE